MRNLVAVHLFAIAFASVFIGAQVSSAPARNNPQIIVDLPENVASSNATVWYALWVQQHGRTGPVTRKSDVHQYVIDGAVEGRPAQHATIYVYAPTCRFGIYDFDLNGTEDVHLRFDCLRLPTRNIRGFILPREIPPDIFSKRAELNISGELEADWICSDVFRRAAGRGNGQGFAGSCLVPPIPLGRFGTLDPDDGGNFELSVPDFTKDPAFKGYAEDGSEPSFGLFELSLNDEQVGRSVGTIGESDIQSPRRGLEIKSKYPNPVVFERIH